MGIASRHVPSTVDFAPAADMAPMPPTMKYPKSWFVVVDLSDL